MVSILTVFKWCIKIVQLSAAFWLIVPCMCNNLILVVIQILKNGYASQLNKKQKQKHTCTYFLICLMIFFLKIFNAINLFKIIESFLHSPRISSWISCCSSWRGWKLKYKWVSCPGFTKHGWEIVRRNAVFCGNRFWRSQILSSSVLLTLTGS